MIADAGIETYQTDWEKMNIRAIKKNALAFVAAAILVVPQMASANLSCGGVVTYVGVSADGTVAVGLAGLSVNSICNVNAQGSFQMTPTSCKMAYALLLANEVSQQRPASILYNDPALTACSQVTAWSTQTSVYFVAS